MEPTRFSKIVDCLDSFISSSGNQKHFILFIVVQKNFLVHLDLKFFSYTQKYLSYSSFNYLENGIFGFDFLGIMKISGYFT